MQRDVSAVGATSPDEDRDGLATGLQVVVIDHGRLFRCRLPTRGSLRIGRAEDSEIVLNDPVASRLHAVLHVGSTLEIVDVGSHNGTLVANRRVTPHRPVALAAGDSIQIGSAILVIERLFCDMEPSSSTRMRIAEQSKVVIGAPSMRAVFDLGQRLAASTINVLVLGETGVGKEVVAESIHLASGRRSQGPFVRINCPALNEALFESELFGHQQGSFTGAVRSKPGLMQTADKGTVFLDEIGEIPLPTQAKLLRVIESREVTPVGALKPIPLDVRFISATNRNLESEIAKGNFREDLYFRLNGVAILVPPLRERVSEIEPLVLSFLSNIACELERPVPRISQEALAQLRRHRWPGNVRELRNVVESLAILTNGGGIELEDLPAHVLHAGGAASDLRQAPNAAASPTIPVPGAGATRAPDAGRNAEFERIVGALAACNGNQTRAAEHMGMPRRTLVAKLAAYSIPRPRKLTRVGEH